MSRTDDKGDPINRRMRASASASVPFLMNDNVYTDAGVTPPTQAERLVYCVNFFCEHDNGYLKMRHSLDSQDLHCIWEWTVGPRAKHYVYVVVPFYRVYEGLDLLVTKVLEVEAGIRMPTRDKMKSRPDLP